MYTVNTSFFVSPQAQIQWLDIIRRHYIPFLNQSGFDKVKFTRMVSENPSETFTYSIMIEVENMEQYDDLTGRIFDHYKEIASPMFGEQVMHFISLLKHLD